MTDWPNYLEHIPEKDRQLFRESVAALLSSGSILRSEAQDQYDLVRSSYLSDVEAFLSVLDIDVVPDDDSALIQARPRESCLLTAQFSALGGKEPIQAMSAIWRPLEFFLITGNYLLFWPFYRALHRMPTQRRRALLNLFIIESCVYCSFTGLLVLAVYKIPDFHHGGFLLADVIYLLLLVVFWIATFGVWAGNRADVER